MVAGRLAGYENRRAVATLLWNFGNVVQKISFKKTGNPENGLKKPVLTVYRQDKLLGKQL